MECIAQLNLTPARSPYADDAMHGSMLGNAMQGQYAVCTLQSWCCYLPLHSLRCDPIRPWHSLHCPICPLHCSLSGIWSICLLQRHYLWQPNPLQWKGAVAMQGLLSEALASETHGTLVLHWPGLRAQE